VKTEKDGTLTVDQTVLAKTLASYPDVVEQMFQASGDNIMGLSAQMNSIQMQATSSIYGLTASYNNLSSQQSDNTDAQTALSDKRQTATDTMTARFSSMNTAVTQYKSIQSFMDQQVKMWTKGN
jgi:flagellar hook-associated protein 2